MGVITKLLRWPSTSLVDLLDDAEQHPATFDLVKLELKDCRTFMVAVICGDQADAAYEYLSSLKDES
jgi:hypothetical protein